MEASPCSSPCFLVGSRARSRRLRLLLPRDRRLHHGPAHAQCLPLFSNSSHQHHTTALVSLFLLTSPCCFLLPVAWCRLDRFRPPAAGSVCLVCALARLNPSSPSSSRSLTHPSSHQPRPPASLDFALLSFALAHVLWNCNCIDCLVLQFTASASPQVPSLAQQPSTLPGPAPRPADIV